MLSIVSCIHNEAGNVTSLIQQVAQICAYTPYELILVNDGSTDDSLKVAASAADSNVILVNLKKRQGQTGALAAGLKMVRGDFVATLDGDLQNDPADLLPMLALLRAEGLDAVFGVRRRRQDPLWSKRLPSRFANWAIRRITDCPLSDLGCSTKVLTRAAVLKIPLTGQRHRLIGVLCYLMGMKIREVDVSHSARVYGQTKYGWGRVYFLLRDLVGIWIDYRRNGLT